MAWHGMARHGTARYRNADEAFERSSLALELSRVANTADRGPVWNVT